MALGPMDAITMLPRTVEAAEMQGKEMNQTQHAADQTAVQFQQRTEQEARQTVESGGRRSRRRKKEKTKKGTKGGSHSSPFQQQF